MGPSWWHSQPRQHSAFPDIPPSWCWSWVKVAA
jgi:hypothetical protein